MVIGDRLTEKASTLAWVENTLKVPVAFQVVEPSKYVVPAPLDLPMNIPARWLSDVAVMNPTCTYPTLRLISNTSENGNIVTRIALDGTGLTMTLDSFVGMLITRSMEIQLTYGQT